MKGYSVIIACTMNVKSAVALILTGIVATVLTGCVLFRHAPTAIIKYTQESPATFSFRSASFDQDGAIVFSLWNFGDGEAASGTNVEHTYAVTDVYVVELTVTDDDGLSASATTSVSASREICVPQDVETIQQAIDSAGTGDTVMVAQGIYTERITFRGKAIEVRSASESSQAVVKQRSVSLPDSTIGAVVTFDSGEGRDSILRGIVIEGLRYAVVYAGGGISLVESSPTIVDCVIRSFAATQGAGVYAEESNAAFVRTRIEQCTARLNGGGVYARGRSQFPEFSECTISDNLAEIGGGCYFCAVTGGQLEPGAILPRVVGCTFARNVATGTPPFGGETLGAAIHVGTGLAIVLEANEFTDNDPGDIGYDNPI